MGKLGIKNILNWKLGLVGLLLIHQLFLLNLKFTAWPEMMLWPYLILSGWLPYRDIAVAHTPFMLLALTAFYKIIGLGLLQLKVFTWLLILLTDLLLFSLVKKIWNIKFSLLVLAFYIPLSLLYEGNGVWFDLALAPLALLVYYNLRQKNYLWAGIWWALAVLTKQTAVWFLIPIGLVMIKGGWPVVKANCSKFLIAAVAVLVVTLLVFLGFGISSNFWFWAFKFGIGILPRAAGQLNFPEPIDFVVATIPFSVLLLLPLLKKKKENFILGSWIFSGALGVFPRWELFHFQPAIPFLAIFWSLAALEIARVKTRYKYVFGVVILATSLLFIRFIRSDWGKEIRFFEPQVLEIASYIKKNTDNNDKIFIINAWDHLYALSDTLPAVKPWIPHLAWYMELPGVQEEIVFDLARIQPRLIVQGEYTDTGLSSYKPSLLDDFIRRYYKVEDKIGNYIILEKR